MTLTEHQQQLATHLWAIVHFIEAHKGKCMPWAKNNDRTLLFRFVADCFYFGKLNIAYKSDAIEAIVFAWPDFKERIEAKDAEGQPQFEWGQPHKGDALFIADVFGSRSAVAKLYRSVIEKYPNLMGVPWFTYRRETLIEISRRELERFARKATHE